MGASFVRSCVLFGLEAAVVTVEADIAKGMPKFTIVGLPDTAVSESRDRVRAAVGNSGLEWPRTKVTVNLAPADIKKQGPMFDLAIALSVLRAADVIATDEILEKTMVVGELALDGALRPIRGALLCASLARERGYEAIIVPEANAPEAGLVEGLKVYAARSLLSVVMHCQGDGDLDLFVPPADDRTFATSTGGPDFSSIKGQETAKRALEIAAAGGHNVLLIGPPGSGKTMLARAFPSIMPDLTFDEALEITKIHSVGSSLRPLHGLVRERPFRTPHHSSSAPALVGGGTIPRPGEVSLAHHGILFLDEFPEFSRFVIEHLRQPLEDGYVTVSRATGTVAFPARFTLMAAMNPCPCGFRGDRARPCVCGVAALARYQTKISGPLLDRIDLIVEVPRLDVDTLVGVSVGEASSTIRTRVQAARSAQRARYRGTVGVRMNAELCPPTLHEVCAPDAEGFALLRLASERLQLSARAYSRVLKVARTIADLAGEAEIKKAHLLEALQFREIRL